jgi:hypothetical protein
MIDGPWSSARCNEATMTMWVLPMQREYQVTHSRVDALNTASSANEATVMNQKMWCAWHAVVHALRICVRCLSLQELAPVTACS